MGTYAAELCHRRDYGRRIVMQSGRLTSIPLAIDGEGLLHKRVDPDGSLARAARLVGIELGDGPERLDAILDRPAHCKADERAAL
jgi:hypothetical protein